MTHCRKIDAGNARSDAHRLCTAATSAVPYYSTLLRLASSDNDEVHIAEEPQNAIVYQQDVADGVMSLSCPLTALTTRAIEWHSESPISTDTIATDNRLVFTNDAHATSSGVHSYHCAIPAGTRSRDVHVEPAFINNLHMSRLDVYATVGRGRALACHPPEHYPPNSLAYAWTYDSVKQYVKQTRRVFQSRDGTLYFAYVAGDDAKNYSCSVANNQMQAGQFGPFFALRVSGDGAERAGTTANQAPVIADDFIKQFPSRVTRGEAVVLECFAYARPAAEYKWRQIDAISGLPIGSAIIDGLTNDGRQLLLTVSTTAVYECAAENVVGVARVRHRVHVFDAPRVTHRPPTTHADIGGRVQLHCAIWANPTAATEWYHNGRPLSALLLSPADRHRITFITGTILVANVTTADSGA